MQSPKASTLQKNVEIVVPQIHFQPRFVSQNQSFIFFPQILVNTDKAEKEKGNKDVTELPPASQILEDGDGYKIV